MWTIVVRVRPALDRSKLKSAYTTNSVVTNVECAMRLAMVLLDRGKIALACQTFRQRFNPAYVLSRQTTSMFGQLRP